jgi:hypothetical protein
VPKSVGQIYGLLYASPEPLSFSDIVEQLEISKDSASQGLQLLRSLGAIKTVDKQPPASSLQPPALAASKLGTSVGGSSANALRRDYYEPELGLRKLVSGVLQERVSPLATAGVERLSRLRELAERDGEGSDFRLDRVKQLETWRRRLRTVLPMLTVLLGPKNKK